MGLLDTFNQYQDAIEGYAGTAVSAAGGVLDEAKMIPGLGSAISGVQGAYHAGAAVYDGVTGDRDGAIAHGVQAGVGFLGMHPGVAAVTGPIDGVLGAVGNTARGVNSAAGNTGVNSSDIPTSLGDIAVAQALYATNAIFGADDSNLIAPGDKPTGSRQGEVNAGLGGVAQMALSSLGPLGSVANLFGADKALGDMAGNAIGGVMGTTNKPGTTSGVAPSAAAAAGQKDHNTAAGILDKVVSGGGATPSNPTPLVPRTPGSGGGGGSSSGPNSGGNPGVAPATPPEQQLIGPGGLFNQGAADASGTMKPAAPMPYGVQPKATPPGPMPYGVQPKAGPGGGGGMSGPMPKMPWFLQPAGPSTW